MENASQPPVLGRYMVADPDICHGKPTFQRTRIFVADGPDQVAAGLAWETIIDEWRGSITQEAIAEAVRLARQALLEHVTAPHPYGDSLAVAMASAEQQQERPRRSSTISVPSYRPSQQSD
jgi:uncharacterized protein (DUF433 family)